MKGRLFASILALVVLGVLTWYLFIKDYNYKISFESSLPPGAVYASLMGWDHLNSVDGDSIKIGRKKPFQNISYAIFEKDSTFRFDWDLERTNDNKTSIVAYISDLDNGLMQNLTVPFKKNNFVKRSVSEAKLFLTYLNMLEKNYEVMVVKDSTFTIPAQYIAYINLHSKVHDKANNMASYIGYIMGYIRENDIPLQGNPFIKVNKINLEENRIEYQFCFPVRKLDGYPLKENIYFKETPQMKAIKANFRGNYRSTEFAWYELMDYAKRNNIDVENAPLEIYLDDPQGGTNSTDWLAEIYLPLK